MAEAAGGADAAVAACGDGAALGGPAARGRRGRGRGGRRDRAGRPRGGGRRGGAAGPDGVVGIAAASTMPVKVVGFDVTIWINEANQAETGDYQVVGKRLAEVFKVFAFQKEQTAGLLYQCRGWTYKKMTQASFLREFGEMLWGGHVSITSNTVHSGRKFNYVMKADTRVEGPWTDADFDLKNPPVLTPAPMVIYF